MICIHGVGKVYPGGVRALAEISLTVALGEVLVLVGRSGSGKSTLLKTINGLVRATKGYVTVAGQAVDDRHLVALRRRMGYVVQQAGLFPHLTVAGNIGLPARMAGWSRERIRTRVRELLDLVGLSPARFADQYPGALSGGEAQRVGVARALMLDPPILLMDEPFSALDPLTRAELQTEFLMWKRSLRKTIVLVTHQLDEAFRLGDRVALMEGGELVQVGTPRELADSPATRHVAEFVGTSP